MENNTFSVIQIIKNTCVVTLYGTYKMGEDNKYTEYILNSMTDNISNTQTQLEYELSDNKKILSIRYKLANKNHWTTEKWLRLPYNEKDKRSIINSLDGLL